MSDKIYTILPNLTKQTETQVYSEDFNSSSSGLSYTFCIDSTHSEVDLNGSSGVFSDLVKSTLKDITPVSTEDMYPTRVGSLLFNSYIYDSESTLRPTRVITYSCVSINGYSLSTPVITLGVPKEVDKEYHLQPVSKIGCSEKYDGDTYIPYTFFRSSSVLEISAASIQLDSPLYSTSTILGTFLPRDNTTDTLGNTNNPFALTCTKDLYVSGSLKSTLKPNTDNTYDLGTSLLKFRNIYGNLTGNLTGNVTGNVTGNITGNVTGNLNGLIPYPVYDNGVITIPKGCIIPCYCTEQRTAGIDLTGTIIGLSSSQNDYWTLLINVDSGNNLFFAKGYNKLPEGNYAVLSGGIASNGDPDRYILLLMKIS